MALLQDDDLLGYPSIPGNETPRGGAAELAPQVAPLTIADLQKQNAGKSEDFLRFQQGDVDRWQQYYDSASGKFRSSRGAPGLFDKPTECPPGMGPSGPNETDPCTANGYGGGGGGGGGAGGGGGTGLGGGGGAFMDVGGQAGTLWDEIMNLQSRYSPEVTQRLMAGAKRQGAAAGTRAEEEANLDLVRRGIARSTTGSQLAQEAGRTAEAAVVNPASTYFAGEKVKADREDKITKLTAMQNWINSARQHIQAMNATQTQKEIALANLDLAEQRLRQELSMQMNSFDFWMAQYARQGIQ